VSGLLVFTLIFVAVVGLIIAADIHDERIHQRWYDDPRQVWNQWKRPSPSPQQPDGHDHDPLECPPDGGCGGCGNWPEHCVCPPDGHDHTRESEDRR
jgi:hypothetical protein